MSHNEIVDVRVENPERAVDVLYAIWDGDLDYVLIERSEVDVWGWDYYTPDNETEWRLRLIKNSGTNYLIQ